jgi:hypothetical protein
MKTYEFRVTVDVEGEPPQELVGREINNALTDLCDIPFGDEDQYEVFAWYVDYPETSVTYELPPCGEHEMFGSFGCGGKV